MRASMGPTTAGADERMRPPATMMLRVESGRCASFPIGGSRSGEEGRSTMQAKTGKPSKPMLVVLTVCAPASLGAIAGSLPGCFVGGDLMRLAAAAIAAVFASAALVAAVASVAGALRGSAARSWPMLILGGAGALWALCLGWLIGCALGLAGWPLLLLGCLPILVGAWLMVVLARAFDLPARASDDGREALVGLVAIAASLGGALAMVSWACCIGARLPVAVWGEWLLILMVVGCALSCFSRIRLKGRWEDHDDTIDAELPLLALGTNDPTFKSCIIAQMISIVLALNLQILAPAGSMGRPLVLALCAFLVVLQLVACVRLRMLFYVGEVRFR